MTLHWYALRSKPRKEEIVWKQVIERGFEVFYLDYVSIRSIHVHVGSDHISLDTSLFGQILILSDYLPSNGSLIRQDW